MKRIIFSVLLLVCSAISAQNSEITFESVEVVPGIYMIHSVGGFGGGNMGLMTGEDYIVMIDDAILPMAPKLQAHVEETAGRAVNLMINTHVHGDHVGGNAHFAEAGTIIFAHENIRKRLLAKPETSGGPGGIPVVTFADGINFHLNGIDAHVIHAANAHTDGDAWIHYPGVNVIHASDLLFHSLFPFIDMDSGGTVDGYIEAMESILAVANDSTKIIPGHGELTDKAGMTSDLLMLKDSKSRIAALIGEGKTEQEILALNPLADYHDEFNWGFITTERMTKTLISDATQ
jgi:cyclase